MRKRLFSFVIVVTLMLTFAATSHAASGSITTLYGLNATCGGFSTGAMFDLRAKTDIVITSFDVNLAPGTHNVSVYYKAGTYVGFETTPGAWTFLGSANVTSVANDSPTALPVGGLAIPAGQTYGLYVDTQHGNNGITFGTDVYANAQVRLTTGAALCGLFNIAVPGLTWNGTVYYDYDFAPPADDDDDIVVVEPEPVPGPDLVDIPAGSVVGTVLYDTPVYHSPFPGATSVVEVTAGKTFWVYGVDSSGGFYKVMMSGKFFWLPVDAMGPNYDEVWQGMPLPTAVVE